MGKIVWESKRAKTWKPEWVSKVIGDTNRVKGDFSIIVSETLPSKKKSMDKISDSVWVCTFDHVKAMATFLRLPLFHTANALVRNQDKDSKSIMLYEYMVGTEFNKDLKMIWDSYVEDLNNIATEERSLTRNLNARKKQADIRLESMTRVFGNLKVIAGEIPAMKNLTDIEPKLLPNKNNDD